MTVALYQRMHQAVGMMDLQVCRDALWAESALVDRKIVSRLKADDLFIFDKQVYAALNAAVWAMGWHDAVDLSIGEPAIGRRIVKMRAKSI